MDKRSVALIVLDGWGIGKPDETNPIHTAGLETIPALEKRFPAMSLEASGIAIGLPWGEVGNSEVGHLTLGSGRVIYQHYPRISMAIRDKSFFKNPIFDTLEQHLKKTSGRLQLVGLLSSGNVHAALEHLQATIALARDRAIPFALHLFADGKDAAPRTLEHLLAEIPNDHIGSLTGRYYGMDREGNWTIVERAYRCITGDISETKPEDLPAIIAQTYEKQGTEEYLPPTLLRKDLAIRDGDAIFCINFREDSMREIMSCFIEPAVPTFEPKQITNLAIATMTSYNAAWTIPVVFPPEHVTHPLGNVLSDAKKTQLRLAESYKQAHVTYFFNGLSEEVYDNEFRVIIPSEPIPHPDERPEMMATAITDRLLQSLETKTFDFMLVNFANPDTIAHTGNFHACEEAVRAVDRELGRIVKAALATNTTLIITSDHGNAEELINPKTGEQETQHDPSAVPLYLVGAEYEGRTFDDQAAMRIRTSGILSDIAPTILELFGIEPPKEMTGKSILRLLR